MPSLIRIVLMFQIFAKDTWKIFILGAGKPRDRTADDIALGHTPIDKRKSATNFIRNYIRLAYRPETYQ